MFPLPGYGGLSPIPAYVPTRMGQGRAEDLMDFRMHKALESQYGVNYASDPMATVAWHGGWDQAGPTVADTWRNQWSKCNLRY